MNQPLRSVQTHRDAAASVGQSEYQLSKWVYHVPDRARYHQFLLTARNGKQRLILAPSKRIAQMQLSLVATLQPHWVPYKCVHGYVERKSILTNASAHLRREWILNLDFLDFFGSITFPRVLGLFKSLGMGPSAAAPLAQLATDGSSLPMGAPSSPLLSNMICRRLDKQCTKLAQQCRVSYTRYADDLTFSGRRWPPPTALVRSPSVSGLLLGDPLLKIVSSNGFHLNPLKSRLCRRSQRMLVTGLVVNGKKPRVQRRFLRSLRAALNAVSRDAPAAQLEFERRHASPFRSSQPQLSEVLRGRLQFVLSIHGSGDPIYETLAHRYAAAFPEQKPPPRLSTMSQFDFFLCHSSAIKSSHALPLRDELQKLGSTSWIDVEQIGVGDSVSLYINEGLKRSRILAVLVSQDFFEKTWAQTEMASLTHREMTENVVRTVPILIGPVEPRFRAEYPLIAHKKWIEWKTAGQVASELHSALGTVSKAVP